MTSALIRTPTQGRVLGVVGDTYRFLATGEETDGRYALIEALVPPGGGPPPHVHRREVEAFYVLAGEITFLVGSEPTVAGPGTFVHIPIGVLHSFANKSEQPARMLISVAPAGLEKMFFEIGQPLPPDGRASPPSPAEIEKLLVIAPRYGVEIAVPH